MLGQVRGRAVVMKTARPRYGKTDHQDEYRRSREDSMERILY